MKLVAVYPILYGARQYEVEDELPDSEMKQTWLDAGTATLVEDEPEAPAPRAQMLTAQPGQIGISNSGNEDDLAGRIPKSIERATDPVKKPTRSRKNEFQRRNRVGRARHIHERG